jgi:hypothetical protein
MMFIKGQNFPLKYHQALGCILSNNFSGILWEASCRDFGSLGSHCISFFWQANVNASSHQDLYIMA